VKLLEIYRKYFFFFLVFNKKPNIIYKFQFQQIKIKEHFVKYQNIISILFMENIYIL